MGTKRIETETKRDAIKRKIENLRLNGDSKFVLSNNDNKYEFKILTVAGVHYKVFGGFGCSLRVFNRHDDAERIITEFEHVLKGMDLSINSCFFVSDTCFSL